MMKKVLLALVKFLPGGHLPVPAALLPVYSHLFPICAGGD